MGSNIAENHPIAFRFALEAKERGAVLINVDPRFTRTSALCDIHAPIRAGTDIAFLGGLINYVLEHDLWFKEYALAFTNIATIIDERFRDTSELDGLFSGWDETSRSYKYDSWQYQGQEVPSSLAEHDVNTTETFSDHSKRKLGEGFPSDPTLQHRNCVYQILRRHYAAYTPEMVERTTGCPRDLFIKIAEAIARNSGRERTGAICYAVGWTHHTTGVQMIRAAAILQGLLGNVGRPGGGILALRGHCSIQGSTDIPTLYNMLPTYLPQPHAFKPHRNFAEYIEHEQTPTGWWHNFPKYAVSLLKAWYGEAATRENGWGFGWLPRIVGDHSQLPMTLAIRDGVIRGMLVIGQNPAVGGHNVRMVQRGLAELEWLVVRDTVESETASFWYAGRPVQDGDLAPSHIKTEVFLMPAALAAEKAGSFTNTHRLLQWHDKVVEPPGDSRSESWFVYQLGRGLKRLYDGSHEPRDAAIQALSWDYPEVDARGEPDAEAVLREMNGYTVADRKQLGGFQELKGDGSTACGAWLYSGVFPKTGDNRARSRKPDGPDGPGTHLDWGWAWPANRRSMYNRASADLDGKPWSERKRLLAWDAGEQKWTGPDVPDFELHKPPQYRPDWSKDPQGMEALGGDCPCIMIADGKISLFTPSGLKDAPLPTHYEPVESPVRNPLYKQQYNPVAKIWARPDNPLHQPADPRFPYALTTYRVTEHHSGGLPTRTTPVLAELQPENFAEISPELADELGIRNLDWVTLATARGEVEVKALVTDRMAPLQHGDRAIHQVGVLWHFGWEGFAKGDIANVLTSVVGDPNTSIHEGKALTCNLRRGRRRDG